jgi:hypothetical protein
MTLSVLADGRKRTPLVTLRRDNLPKENLPTTIMELYLTL